MRCLRGQPARCRALDCRAPRKFSAGGGPQSRFAGRIWEDFRLVGEAAGIDAEPVIRRVRLQPRTCLPARAPTVACIEWIEPLMAAGNWTPELIQLAGGVDVFGNPGIHSPWIAWEELVARDPDVIVVAPCGFDVARARQEMHWLTERPEFSSLKAVRTGRFHVADGNRCFNCPGPSVVESYRFLRSVLEGGAGASACPVS